MLLDSLVNLPTALLALAGNLFYVLVYTRWLKRSTPQNIVIGGAAGAVPPLVGCARPTGHLGWAALAMFSIVFLWTPPHFWALALMIREHYANAEVPMLPVVRGERETARQIAWYSVALVAATLVPVAFGVFGLVYGGSALVLGALFAWLAFALWRADDAAPHAVKLFHFSHALPRPALRRDGDRRDRLMSEPVRADTPGAPARARLPARRHAEAIEPTPEIARKNMRQALFLVGALPRPLRRDLPDRPALQLRHD